MFFVSRIFGGALSIDAKRQIWFMERASIFAFLLLLLFYWGLCCEILQLSFSLKYNSNGTLNDCAFESVSVGVVMGNSHWKSQISNVTRNVRSWKSCGHSSMKRFPIHLWQERSFLCNGEDTKFRFEWLITCPQTKKKGVKRLLRGRNTSILEQTLWKQTDPISLIFNRPETVRSYIKCPLSPQFQRPWTIVASNHFKREEVVGRVPLFLGKIWNKFLRLPRLHASFNVTGTRINR